jgi:hypothetical protein
LEEELNKEKKKKQIRHIKDKGEVIETKSMEIRKR